MQRLQGTVQHYAWGSTTALPELLGVPADGRPWAELWFGAHPSAPSMLPQGGSLAAAVAADPHGWLGEHRVAAAGQQLPFLLKLLAAAEPLSLQAHPDAEQARAGFAREEAAGVPADAPHRLYRDPNPKPELIVALTTFRALCGFRPADEVADELAAIGIGSWAGRLRRDGLAATVAGLYGSAPAAQVSLVRRVAEAHPFVAELHQRHPDDIGCVVALFCRQVTLAPGQALELPARNLHAYLEGFGVELMANSDNVLRGGLTPKHVDVDELLRVVRVDDTPVPILTPTVAHDGWSTYPTTTEWFALRTVSVDGAGPEVPGGRPAIVLCTAGTVDVAGSVLRAGEAAAVRADDPPAAVTGHGTLWLATTP